MDKLRLGLVGCGGMGTRHLYGLKELTDTRFSNVELAADEAEKLLGERPQVFTQVEDMARSDRNVSVAENFRRDPSARIVYHLLENGEIGKVHMALIHLLGAGDTIFISPWRHKKEMGDFILDMTVHNTHMIRYQLGEIAEVYGDARMVEPVRRKAEIDAALEVE